MDMQKSNKTNIKAKKYIVIKRIKGEIIMTEMLDTVHTHTHTDNFNEQEKTKQRKSNLELLRIFSMFLIIISHFSYHSGFDFGQDINFNRIFIRALQIGAKIGVDCFVLISGYCMINSKFKMSKLINLIIEVFIYSLLGLTLEYILKPTELNFKNIIKSFFPVTFGNYWFITTYIVLYLLSPFINKFINMVEKKFFQNLLIILIFIEIIIPTISTSEVSVHGIILFITLYMIGAYINKFPNNLFNSKRVSVILTIIMYALLMISVVVIDFIGTKMQSISSHIYYFTKENSIPTVLCSIFIFMSFKNIKIFYNKNINKIASTTLGIYLIHENMFIRPIIWKDIFKCNAYINSQYLILNAIISIISVFIICIIIDILRQATIGRFINKVVEYSINKYRDKIKVQT